MSYDEQPYDKEDHDLHDACEEIARLKTALKSQAEKHQAELDQTRKGVARLRKKLIEDNNCGYPNKCSECLPAPSSCHGILKDILDATKSISSWHDAIVLRAEAKGWECARVSLERRSDSSVSMGLWMESEALKLRSEADDIERGDKG